MAAPLLFLVFAGGSAASSARQSLSSPEALTALIADGTALAGQGRYRDALPLFQRAAAASERLDDDRLLADSLYGRGWAEWGLGDYAPSVASRRAALELYTRLDDVMGRAKSLNGLGVSFFSMGRYQDALERYEAALDAAREAGSARQEGLVLSNIGVAYRFQGRYDQAAETLHESLGLLGGERSRKVRAQALNHLGIVHRARGDYALALQRYTESLAIRTELQDRQGESQALNNIGNIYLDQGQLERAIEHYAESLVIAEEIGYTAQVGFAHRNIGAALSRLNRAADALARYESALAVWRKIGRRAEIAWTLKNIGALRLFQLDDPAGARAALVEALALAREVGDPEAEGHALYELGNLARLGGNPARALAQFDEALAIARRIGSPDLEYQVHGGRGVALHALGRTADAIASLRAGAAIVNDLRANVSSDQSKIGFVDTRQAVFHDLARVLTAAGRHEEALEAAEAARARAFADLLSQREVLAAARMQPVEDVRAAVRRHQQQQTRHAVEAAPATRRERTRGGSQTLEEALRRLRADNPELGSLVEAESPTSAEIKAIAARLDATLVEYLVTGDALYAWVVSSTGAVQATTVKAGRERLTRLVADLRQAIERADLAALRNPEALRPALRELHDLLIAPLDEWLPASPAETVVLVPHGPLALLPFAALEDAAGTPLIERHTLAIAPAISVFRYTPAKARLHSPARSPALVVAAPLSPEGSDLAPLSGAADEGRLVAATLGGEGVRLLIGARASEATVKRESGAARLLHFATHALVSPDRPAASSLVLAPGGGEDGYLDVGEIFGLDLQAGLVVLSGCSTAAGRLTADGIFGLTRAFIYAGSPSVVVSNWDVSDQATTYLMNRFYQELRAGSSKASALRTAALGARARFRHPALWAAFVLVGEPQ